MTDPEFSNNVLYPVINGLTFNVKKKEEDVYTVNTTTPRSGNFEKYLNTTFTGIIKKNLTSGEWELVEGTGLTPEMVRQIGMVIDNKV